MMARRIERIDPDGRRTITMVEDRDVESPAAREGEADRPIMTREAQVIGEEEVTSTRASGWNVARGMVRTMGLMVGFTALTLEVLLSFRLAFALAAANRANGFVEFIYDVSYPFVYPFEGITSHRGVGDNGVFEPEAVIAMAVYAVAAMLVVGLLWVLTSAPSSVSDRAVVTRERRTGALHEN